jgi:AAHS family 4-hydroxybenzoate transporter-like MFS transporter
MTVTATIVSFPLGGMLAGVYAAYALSALGWRGLFLAGGMLPVAFACVLMILLPESPRYLARHPARWGELLGFLGRTGRALPADTVFTDRTEQATSPDPAQRGGLRSLFEDSRARDTIALWLSFFACLFTVYSAFSWLPTMLVAEGFPPSVAGGALAAYNLGGVFGALICAQAITRFGSRWPMILCGLGGAMSVLLLKVVPNDEPMLMMIGFGLHGLFVNAVNCTLYAVSAFLYPTDIRATGTATALSVGRLGAILSSFVGAAVITAGGASAFLTALGLAMLVVAVGLAVLRNHIAPTARIGLRRPLPSGS